MTTPSCPTPADDDSAWLSQAKLFARLIPKDQIEQRAPCPEQTFYTPHLVLHLMLFQKLNQNATLDQAVSQLDQHFPRSLWPHCKRAQDGHVSVHTGGYSQARTRLASDLVHWATQYTYDTLVGTYAPSYYGRRVFLIDGTTATLPPTPALREAYPPATNQHGTSAWPIMLMVTAFELASGLAAPPETGPMYGPAPTSELDLATKVLDHLPSDAIVVGDRNFGVFTFAYEAMHRGHQPVVRLTGVRFRSLQAKARPVGNGRWQLDWRSSREDRRNHRDLPADACVSGWLVSHRVSETESLYLFSPIDASPEALAEVYGHRWGAETNIGEFKGRFQAESIRCRSKPMVEKELLVTVMGYNLTVQVRRLAAQRAGVEPRRLSFTGVWWLVVTFLQTATEETEDRTLEERFDRLLEAAGQKKLPNRKRKRSYPRTAYVKRNKFPLRKGPTDHEMQEQTPPEILSDIER